MAPPAPPPTPQPTPLGPFDTLVGFAISEASGDRVAGRLEVTPSLHQPFGIVHGGVYCTLVETAASFGGAAWLAERGTVVGVSNHTDFFRSVTGGVLDVVALPVHRGRTQQVWQVEITDEQGRLVSRGQVRLANLTDRAG